MSRRAKEFDYASKVHHWINRSSFALRSEMQRRLKAAGHGITVEEWALMMVVWADGPVPMSDLAKATLRDRTTVTRVVDRLVAKGLLKRQQAEADRRQVVMEATKAARGIEGDVMGVAQGLIRDTLIGIPKDDIAVTLRTLKALNDNIA